MNNQIAKKGKTSHRNNNNGTSYHNTPKAEKPQPMKKPSHYQQCEALLGKSKGWQRIFLAQLLKQSSLNIYQKEKLTLVAQQLEAVPEARLCRYCFSQAIWQSPYYVCPKCGECLNIEFSALEIAGGEIDA